MSRLKVALAAIGVVAVVAASVIAINLPATLNGAALNGNPAAISKQIHQDVSAPLSSIQGSYGPIREDDRKAERKEELREETYPKFNKSLFKKGDPVVQKTISVKSGPLATAPKFPTATGFDGLGDGTNSFSVNSVPPDTNMDVSNTQIVEVVNTAMAVFNKTGSKLYGPVPLNTLWSGFGGGCQADNDGDPTVAFDRLANRWVISQFAVGHTNDGSVDPYLQCVAVSKTSDALGQYYRYSFGYSVFPDYPKLAVWPDAYYTTFNGFGATGSAWTGSFICAYDRIKMLSGLPASQACTSNDPHGGVLVATMEGTNAPAVGTSAYAMSLHATNAMALWRLTSDFGIGGPTITKSAATYVTIPNFDLACPASVDYTCVPQYGTSNTLDTLGDRLMNRFSYRKIASQESFLVSHTVDVSGTTSVRWYEFRPSGSSLTTYQSGTYNPDNSHRWMPSIGMDQVGNVGLVYSKSSGSIRPSIVVAGRLATDTLGTLGQGETVVKAGTGSQTTYSRWGDYAAIALDPADDCTFWSATEYLAADGIFNWQTYISKFKFSNCGGSSTSITSITSSGSIGSTITISGSGLSKVNLVKIGGVGATNVSVRSGVVRATVAPGTTGGQVWVKTSDGQTATSNDVFTLTYPKVTATSISPKSVKIGASLTISGTNLDLVRSVTIDGVSAPTFTATASNIYVAVPAGVSAGNAKTVVLNTPNSVPNVSAPSVTIATGSTLPSISRLSTTRGGPGASIVISGSNLASSSSVKFGDYEAIFVVISDSQIVASVPVVASGSANLTVTTSGGTSSASSFTYQSSPSRPSISSVTPTSTTVGSLVTVNGGNLAGVTSISFNGTTVISFKVISATQITFTVPAGATSGAISLSSVGGTASFAGPISIY